ncbi:MAG TPA: peptidylprolyl isomerase, partial [Cyclobacteriaceae bacterium]|nr:peptidylprolyl isomerase [Cyclobacteriaceae bacterium]
MLRSVLLSFIICVFAFTASAQKKQNQKKNAEILFIVGSSAVSAEEFIELYKKNHPDNKDYTKEAIGNYLDLFIKFKQKVQAARDLGLDTATAFINEFAGYKEELKRPYMADATLLDDLVKEAYDRYKTEINASHILISVNPEATPQDTLAAYQKISNIRARLASGEDFAVLAAQLSEDPSAKYNFGNLGWFTSMQMVYPFESAAYKTAKAELSEIVKTRFGYHLLKVHDIRPASGEVEVAHIMLRTGAGKDSLQVVN